MPSAGVIFDGDTGRFRAEVDAAGNSVSKAADAIAVARNKILDSFNAQIAAAKENGASAERMASIQTKAAQSMAAVTDSNAQKIINSLDRISAKQKAVAAELGNLQVPHVAENDITDRQRASALIRGGGVRAAENFATQFTAFNQLSAIAFPILGATTFVAEIVRGVSALKEMYETAKKLPEALREGWDSLNSPLMLSVDNMRKVNDELEIAHQKFAHQPENLLALAIDEDRIKADQLAASARKAATDIAAMLKANHSGFTDFVLTGAAGTKVSEDAINGWFAELTKKQTADREALRSGTDTPQAAQRRKEDIAAFIKQKYAEAGQDAKDAGQFNLNGMQAGNIQNFQGARERLGLMMDQSNEDDRNTRDTINAKNDAQQKQRAEDAKAAAAKAKEAMRQAIESQRQLWQAQDDQLKEAGGQTAALEAFAWQARIDALKKGSAGYAQQLAYAQHQLATAKVEANKQDAETAKRDAEQAQKSQIDRFALDRDSFATSGNRTPQQMADLAGIQMLEALPANIKEATNRWREAQAAADRYAEEAQKAADKVQESAIKNKAAYDLASLAIAEQTGQISRLDAAQQTSNIHAAEYASTMANLRKVLSQAQAKDPNGPDAINAQTAIDKATADRNVQVIQDAATTAAATWQGALRKANAVWVQDSQDSARQVVQFYRQALDGLNQNLSDLMTGKRANFAGYFQGLGKTLANDSLQHIEGSVLGKFGIHTGKPDGSKSNPLNVNVVGGMAGMGMSTSALGKAMFPGLGGDDSDSSGSSNGGFLGGLAKFAVGLFGGARAMGGGVDFGSTYLVGEAGPELFSPKASGTIIPNHALGGGMNFSPTVQVANGVTPSQMEMRLRSVMRQSMPSLLHAAHANQKDAQSRRPTSHH